ncbi:unnamed protein product [Absidia cylindrospora]
MAKNVLVRSTVLLTDAYDNTISETSEDQPSHIDNPLLRKQQEILHQPPPARLSNMALSVGLTQHFIDNRRIRLPSLSSTSTAPGIENRSSLNASKFRRPDYIPSTSSNNPGTSLSNPKEHISVLRVFAGNINVKATFNSVLINENTTTEQLLVLALDRFRILDSQQQRRCNGVEYYITVKVSDEVQSPTHTNWGDQSESNNNTEASFGQNSVARFTLNKRIKLISEQDGHLRIKIAYYDDDSTKPTKSNSATTTSSSTSRFSRLYHRSEAHQRRSNHTSSPSTISEQRLTRIEKLVAVPGKLKVKNLTQLALEKFHIQQNLDKDHGSRLDMYGMALMVHREEHLLDGNRNIIDIMDDKQLSTNGNYDGVLFILKKMPSSTQSSSSITKQKNQNDTLVTMANDQPLGKPTPPSTQRTHDFCNSDISLISTSTSSDSSQSLISPDSTCSSISTPQHVKSTTSALLERIDVALSNLEQNESLVSGAYIDTSSIKSTYMSILMDRNTL